MSHLVPAISNKTVGECLIMLREAHDYLARQGAVALCKSSEVSTSCHWGANVKRVPVSLPNDTKPSSVSTDVLDHSLVEVINQCATMERLIDALEWANSTYTNVEKCHPTTSSENTGGGPDNDLILVAVSGKKARFEISDVASEKDGNGKAPRDLVSLGVLTHCDKKLRPSDAWPAEQLFLVVSEEFAKYLRKWKPSAVKDCHCAFKEVKKDGQTRIFEVCKGSRWV